MIGGHPADIPHMKNRFSLTLFLCATSLFAARADAQVVPGEDHVGEVGVMFWRPSPDLVLSSSISGVSDHIDFVKEFGIEDKTFPEFQATLGSHHKFRFSYVEMKYDADATITRTFRFNGRTFTVGAPASTNIDWKLWNLGYEWDFVHRERGFFGLLADVKINKIETSIESTALSSPATTDTNAPVPTIGVIGRGYVVPAVSITGEFTGFKVDKSDFNVKFTDFNLYGTANFGRNLGAQVGYRSVIAKYVVDNDNGDLKMQGPYFGAVVKF
jgi:hypothetical protein